MSSKSSKSTKPATTKAPTEAVNSEQLDAMDQEGAASAAIDEPTDGEREEQLAEAQNQAEELKRENAELRAMLKEMNKRMKAIEQRAANKSHAADDDSDEPLPGEVPVFDPEAPHGVVSGDSEIAYVQNGYQFGPDRSFVAREANRGTPRPFNIRHVGLVKPRAGSSSVDALDGFRNRD